MVESVQDQATFISTDDLAALMNCSPATLRILNCSVKMGVGPDPLLEHSKKHIKGARFFDLHFCKDLSSPFPFMMPN